MVRDSKGWRIDRRRSVTRYSCQQAAGIAVPLSHLPFPPLSRPYAPPSLARQPSRSLATDAGLPRNILHVNAASMFSQRRGLSMASSVPGPFLLPPPLSPPHPPYPHPRVPFPAYRAPPFTRLQRFIPRSWNTAAVTPALALIGANCSIFHERRFWCIDLELRRRRYRETAESKPMSAEN